MSAKIYKLAKIINAENLVIADTSQIDDFVFLMLELKALLASMFI